MDSPFVDPRSHTDYVLVIAIPVCHAPPHVYRSFGCVYGYAFDYGLFLVALPHYVTPLPFTPLATATLRCTFGSRLHTTTSTGGPHTPRVGYGYHYTDVPTHLYVYHARLRYPTSFAHCTPLHCCIASFPLSAYLPILRLFFLRAHVTCCASYYR